MNIMRSHTERRPHEKGKWEKGPGMDLFNTLNKKIENLRVIAEDLGFLTESVLEMLKESGYPGMKVLQFAFDGSENSCLSSI